MTEIDARTVDGYTWVVGQTVKVGKGAHVWRITGFFGPSYSYASLKRVGLDSTNTSAHLSRLRPHPTERTTS